MSTTSFSEDSQPNETRLRPKGAAVPLVRSTDIRASASFRARYADTTLLRSLPKGQQCGPPLVGPIAASSPSSSYMMSTTYDKTPIPQKRPAQSAPEMQSPWKRQKKDSMAVSKEIKTVTIQLPRQCVKGAPNSQKLRKSFVRHHVEGFQKQPEVKIMTQAVLGNTLHITLEVEQGSSTERNAHFTSSLYVSRSPDDHRNSRPPSPLMSDGQQPKEGVSKQITPEDATVERSLSTLTSNNNYHVGNQTTKNMSSNHEVPWSLAESNVPDNHDPQFGKSSIPINVDSRLASTSPIPSIYLVNQSKQRVYRVTSDNEHDSVTPEDVQSMPESAAKIQHEFARIYASTGYKAELPPASLNKEDRGLKDPVSSIGRSTETLTPRQPLVRQPSLRYEITKSLPVGCTDKLVDDQKLSCPQLFPRLAGYPSPEQDIHPAPVVSAPLCRMFRSGVLTVNPCNPSLDKVSKSPPLSSGLPVSIVSPVSTPDDSSIILEKPSVHDPKTYRDLRSSVFNDLPSTSSCSIVVQAHRDRATTILQPEGEVMHLHRDVYDRPRCLLVSCAQDAYISVSMRGLFHEVTRKLPRRQRVIQNLQDPTRDSVEDACLLSTPHDAMAVIGQIRAECQLSLVHMTENTRPRVLQLSRPVSPVGKRLRGVSCVSSMHQPLTFVTGGHDHVVHLWKLNDDITSATSTTLQVKHTSLIQSLLPIRDTNHKLFSAGADCCVNLWDISSERNVHTIRTSNSVYHLHSLPQPSCVCLEVAHRDSQFEIRDYRAASQQPIHRFGYPSAQVHGRFIKGDIKGNTLVCGDRDGNVRLWDFRSTKKILQTVSCFPGQKVTQVLFDKTQLMACSNDYQLMFMNNILTL